MDKYYERADLSKQELSSYTVAKLACEQFNLDTKKLKEIIIFLEFQREIGVREMVEKDFAEFKKENE